MRNVKNAAVCFEDVCMEYVRFGSGPRTLVMLPGLGDGLRTVRGTALPMGLLYRKFAKSHTVYMFSRRSQLPQGFSTLDMARDQKGAMEALGISRADVIGVSMGGMIAQQLAAEYPEAVDRLVLVVTGPGPNPVLKESLDLWTDQACQADHTALMDSNLKRIYSDGYYRKNKWMVPLLGRLTKPRSYDRFLCQAAACAGHDAREALRRITAPTLVLGGEQDACLGAEPSRELAAGISGAKLYMYSQWGHGLYEEAPDFQDRVLAFLTEK